MKKTATLFLYSILFALGTSLIILNFYSSTWIPSHLSCSTEILDYHSERLRLYTTPDGYWRLPISIANLDPRFIQFLLTYEDRRFYTHPGVDWLALLRATIQALTTGHLVSGGSTISMQTVRLFHPRSRTLINKLIEMFTALWIEQHLTKAQILTLYLTLAPYGGNIQGIRAASWFYFGKEPNFLNVAESALLIALPQAPEARRPDRAMLHARTARAKVLQRLVTAGFIDNSEATEAAAAPMPSKRRPTPRLAPHFTDRVHAANTNLQSIHTTINAKLQRQLEMLLAQHQKQQVAGVTIAALVIENHTWAVRAYAGSADYFSHQFSGQLDMVRAVRSPGSTLKPLMYGLAFDAGIAHPETLIFDRPESVNGYAPGNFDRRYYGEMTVREALRTSRNIPAIKILNRLGPDNLFQRLASIGINLRLPNTLTQPGLPIVLGGAGLRLEDLAKIYVGLANGGIVKELNWLENAPSTTFIPIPTQSKLLSPTATWYVTDILATSQPPPGFSFNQHQLAFKTGTSYGFRDAWSLGYNAAYTVAVWLGRPDNGYTAVLSGLQSAVPIMLEIFDKLPKSGLAPLLQSPPVGVLLTQNAALPPKLRHFDYRTGMTPIIRQGNSQLTILYPPSGATVELATNAAMNVHLEISGGKAPFYILENGRPVANSNDRRNLNWIPNMEGIVQLSILDTKGQSDQVQVRIQKLKILHQMESKVMTLDSAH